MSKIYANGFEPGDFSSKYQPVFRLFGSDVLVQELPEEGLSPNDLSILSGLIPDWLESDGETDALLTTCARLAVPHTHIKGADGHFHCTFPDTLESL